MSEILPWIIATTSIISAIAGFMASLFGILNNGKIQEVHLLLNSRLDQLIRITSESQFAKGLKMAREEQNKND
jgi:hypothetical protein